MKSYSQPHLFRRGLTVALLIAFLLNATSSGWQRAVVDPTSDSTLTATEREAAASLKADTIRDVTTALASSEMQGRGTAQLGGDKAAQYIAGRFATLGIKPLGDKGTYLQTIKFKETRLMPESSLQVGGETLELGADFVVSPPYTGERNVDSYMPKMDDLSHD